jgi:hypothetical protein
MFGKKGTNCDRHQYFPEMGAELRRVLLSEPKYMVGIQPLSLSYERSEQIKEFCQDLKIDWYDADALHSASIDGKLSEFFYALKNRYVILVGPAHLADLFDCVHIVIPPVDCWLLHGNTVNLIEDHLEDVDNAVVLLCASMTSEVIIDEFSDTHHTFIDCGSVFDPYAGVKSRKYHHKLRI